MHFKITTLQIASLVRPLILGGFFCIYNRHTKIECRKYLFKSTLAKSKSLFIFAYQFFKKFIYNITSGEKCVTSDFNKTHILFIPCKIFNDSDKRVTSMLMTWSAVRVRHKHKFVSSVGRAR